MISDLHVQFLARDVYEYDIDDDIYNYKDNIKFSYKDDKHITITPHNIPSLHLLWYIVRTITNKYNNTITCYDCDKKLINNFMLELNEKYTKNKYHTINSRCLICNSMDCCNNTCKTRLYYTITDNTIMDMYNSDSNLCYTLLHVFDACMNTNRTGIITPLPIFENCNNVNSVIEYYNRNNNNTILNIINIFKNSKTDIDVYNQLGNKQYCIIKNALSNNFFSMNTKTFFETKTKFTEMIDNDYISIIKINYSAELENQYPNKYYLYHGSSLDCWYPIIKNGLKNMSGTANQINGAAYGSGIYFSDSSSFSYNYSGTKYKIKQNADIKIVGVFEIKEDPNTYKKTNNIFVIPDETIVLMRYLIVFKKNSQQYDQIDNYFRNFLTNSSLTRKIESAKITDKRLNNELKKLNENSKIKSINTDIVDCWYIELHNTKHIEIKFNKYPVIAPTMTIIKENNKCVNTKVELEELIPSKWKPTNLLTNIIDKIN